MKNVCDWLTDLGTEHENLSWLSPYEQELFQTIQQGLNYPPDFHCAVQVLILVFPFFAFVRSHTQKWVPLLHDALVTAQDLRDNEIQTQILTQMGEGHLTMGKHMVAQTTLTIALERAKDEQVEDMMLAAYIGLIKLQSIYREGEFRLELFQQVEKLIPGIQDDFLRATARQTLATAYAFMGNTRQALGQGQTAYAYWCKLENLQGMAETAYRIAVQYWSIQRLDLAGEYLRRAQDHFLETDYARQFGLSAYAEGILCYQRQEYAVAEQWLQQALGEFRQINRPYDIALAQHGLGLAQTGLSKFEPARANLKQAVIQWEYLHNAYELASVHQALGYLEGKQGNQDKALALLDQALTLCADIAESPARTKLVEHIQATMLEFIG